MFRSFLLIFCKGKSSAWYFFFFLNSWQRFHDRNVCISPLLHFVCINSVFYIFIYISITFPIPYISIKQRNVSFVNANHFFSFLTKVSWPKCCRHRKYWISCRLRSMQDFFYFAYFLYPVHLPATIQVCKRCLNRENRDFFFRLLLLQKARVQYGP